MAAARTRVRGLGPDEVEKIRVSLAAGRKPRVMFTASAGQIAGQIGQVVALTDPAVSEEFVVVRFGRDELPFSPGDMELAPRGATVQKPAPVAEPVRAEPEFLLGKPAKTTARRRGDSASLTAGPRDTDAGVAQGQGAPAAGGTNGASPTRAGSAPAARQPGDVAPSRAAAAGAPAGHAVPHAGSAAPAPRRSVADSAAPQGTQCLMLAPRLRLRAVRWLTAIPPHAKPPGPAAARRRRILR